MIPSSLQPGDLYIMDLSHTHQPGDLYIMDLSHTHTQVITTESGNPVGYTHQGELCLVLQIKPNHVQFLTSWGIPGWIHREWFYPPDLPGD